MKNAEAWIGFAVAVSLVALLVWIASGLGASKAGFLGAAVLFGGVQLACLSGLLWVRRITDRSRRVFVGFFCFYTLFFCGVAELVALGASIPALRESR